MLSTQIIVVNYNAGDWLLRCITSVLEHTDQNVTVVDNDSIDDSIKAVQQAFTEHPRIKWQLNQKNIGFAAANNQVLKELDAEFALLLNPDCELNKETLPLMLRAFEKTPSMGLASCRIYNEDGSLQTTCRRRFPTPWFALVRLLQLHRLFPNNPKFANFDYGEVVDQSNNDLNIENIEAVSGAFMMVRKAALNEVGLLDEAYFMHCEDLDWCKRFEQSNWSVGFVNDATVVHAKGVSSQSRPIRVLWTLHKGMNLFFDKHYYADYSLPVRYLVKLGIIVSFTVRSCVSLMRGLWHQITLKGEAKKPEVSK